MHVPMWLIVTAVVAIVLGLLSMMALLWLFCRWVISMASGALHGKRTKSDAEAALGTAVFLGGALAQGWGWFLLPFFPLMWLLGKQRIKREARDRAAVKAEIGRYEKEFPPRVYR